jgi:HSP20 family molecular chaperone IbpA
MSRLSNVFHHFAFTHPQIDPSLLESQRDPASVTVFSPKVDLRECTSAYFLEAELPGIHGSNDVGIRWLDESTLQIEVTIRKTDLEAEWGDLISYDQPFEEVLSASDYENRCDERNGIDKKIRKQEAGQHISPESLMTRFWLDERRTGVYLRNFHFGLAVDTGAIQVRLRQGLLKVFLPKMNSAAYKTKEISIEVI